MIALLENMKLLLQYSFIRKALIVGPFIAVCAALLGVTLVTSRRAMIGDGLSHVSFCAVAVALAVGISPLILSIPTVIVSAILILRESERKFSEASVALFAGGALSIGTFVLSTARGMNMDVSDYMFGSIFTLSESDTILCFVCAVCVSICYVLLYRRVFAVNFDKSFAASIGINVGIYGYIMATLTAVTIVISMKIMGVMLVTALIIFPTLSAMQICKSYQTTILFAAISSFCCFLLGVLISLALSVPAGATVVLVYFSLLIICGIYRLVQNGIFELKAKNHK